MPIATEKTAFTERLKTALKRAPKAVKTATELAHEFNLRHPKEPGITPQAAQKWLSGKAKPSADKLDTLAEWLGVSAHWLAYGPAPTASKKTSPGRGAHAAPTAGSLTEKETRLVSRLRTLSEHQVYLVAELVDQLAAEREINGRG